MAAFSTFWTAVGVRLAAPPFDLGQRGLAIFALAGAGGALSALFFGRIGDRGFSRQGLLIADLIVIAGIALVAWSGLTEAVSPMTALLVMCFGAFWIDVGITGDQTLGRRAINLLSPESRARINGLFVGIFFIGGAIGSGSGRAGERWGGWAAVCGLAGFFGFAALLVNGWDRSG